MRHESYELLERYVLREGGKLCGSESMEGFVDELRSELKRSLSSPTFLHGKRTEAMFEMIVASLANVRVLKQEDGGELFHKMEDKLAVPDFRLVLENGEQCLVEVKNFYHKDGAAAYKMDTDYVASLVRYSKEMDCRLLFAIYWARWNIWTLTDEIVLDVDGKCRSLELGEAMRFNEMAAVGDRIIGTRSPISIQFEVAAEKRSEDGTEQRLRIESMHAFSEERALVRADERNFASFLIFYGDWEEEEEVEVDNNGLITSITFQYSPPGECNTGDTQMFSKIGTLSGMLSRKYAAGTLKGTEVSRARKNYQPGSAAKIIPERDESSRLPLWIFEQRPCHHKEESPDSP